MGGALWIWVGNGALRQPEGWRISHTACSSCVLLFPLVSTGSKWCLGAKSLGMPLLVGGSICTGHGSEEQRCPQHPSLLRVQPPSPQDAPESMCPICRKLPLPAQVATPPRWAQDCRVTCRAPKAGVMEGPADCSVLLCSWG